MLFVSLYLTWTNRSQMVYFLIHKQFTYSTKTFYYNSFQLQSFYHLTISNVENRVIGLIWQCHMDCRRNSDNKNYMKYIYNCSEYTYIQLLNYYLYTVHNSIFWNQIKHILKEYIIQSRLELFHSLTRSIKIALDKKRSPEEKT